jgi:hypothetical protein
VTIYKCSKNKKEYVVKYKEKKRKYKKKKKKKKGIEKEEGWEDKCSIFEGDWVVEGVRHDNRNVI